MKYRVFLALCLLILPFLLVGQSYQPFHTRMNHWHFGNGPRAIKFNRPLSNPNIINTKFSPFGTGGSATATDAITGNLLFYTDGSKVFDGCNLLMPNGSGILGSSASNQSVAICPVPGQPNKYFIFANSATNTASGTITYDVVDLLQLGNTPFPSVIPLGDLEGPFHTPVVGLTGRSEAMIIVPHSNGIDYWLITKVANSQDYSATLINAAAYNPAHTGAFTTNTTSGLGLVMSASHFAYHADPDNSAFGKIAVAPTSSSRDATIINFNNTLGDFLPGPDVRIFNSATATTNNQSIYDIEWSGDGRFIYFSVFGDETAATPGDVFQYDTQNPLNTLVTVLPSTVFRSYGLQLAPDSSIYHLYQTALNGNFLIGRISDPDSVAALANYAPLPFGNINFQGTQFSAVLPKVQPVITVIFTSAGTCQNTPTSFYPTVSPVADSLVWDYGDGSPTDKIWSPVHTYTTAGTYSVSVTAFFQGQPQLPPTTNSVTINAFPLSLQLVADTTACTHEFPPPIGTSGPPLFSVKVNVSGGSASSFLWSNGDNTDTLFPDSAGYYYVVVGDGSGCTAYAGVNVKEYGVPDQRFNVWYFGNKAGIDFNQTPSVKLSDGVMDAPEGCSAMSDRNGQLLFYTDGNNVFDQTHTQIATGIGGDPTSTQSVLIVPMPNDETLYYIFTTEAKEDYPSNTLYYSLFDLKQNGGFGAVVQQKIPLFSKSTERIASNGRWLIAHEYGNNSFRCYELTPNGIGQPVITTIGSNHDFKNPSLAEGYMKISSGNMVAVALSIPGSSNFVEVFNLNNNTGVLSNIRRINLREPNGQVYGLEFSPGGNKMYATVKGSPTPSFVYEYSIDSVKQFHFKQKVSNPSEIGAVQIAPDGQIYFAINGSGSLGSILVNEDTTQLSSFNFAGYALASGTTSRLGLPSFVQQTGSAFGGPGMSVADVCIGSPLNYVGTPTDPIDTFLWTFDDGGTSTTASGQHNYATTGTYTVRLEINNRCLIAEGLPPFTFVDDVVVETIPAPPTIPLTDALCIGNTLLNANTSNIPSLTFLWNTNETTAQIGVANVGTYSVTITNATGCTSTGATTIIDGRPIINLGPDLTICQGTAIATLNAGNPPPTFSHAWTLDGVSNGNTSRLQPVSTAAAGTDTYQVSVTNNTTNCVISDAVTFTIRENPTASMVLLNSAVCTSPGTGRIDLTISPLAATTQPPIHTFSYTIAGPVPSLTISQAPGLHTIPNLTGGNYTVTVSDELTGCFVNLNGTISNLQNTLTASDLSTCTTAPIAAVTDANTIPIAGNFTYQVFNLAGTQVDNGTKNAANFNTKALPPGIYTIQVTKSGCIAAADPNVVITQLPQVAYTTIEDACALLPTLTGVPDNGLPTNFVWTGRNANSTAVINNQTSTVLTLNKAPGNYSFNVIATQGTLCPTPSIVTIKIESEFTPTITASDPCENQVTLKAIPSTGGYSYSWLRDGTIAVPPLVGKQISLSLADDGHTYAVELVSQIGCTYASLDLVASVVGPVQISPLSVTPVCADGSPFSITATSTAASPTFEWFRKQGTNYILLSGEENSTTTQTVEGDYKVVITQGSCTAKDSIQLSRNALPVGGLPEESVICDDPENVDVTTNHVDLDPGIFEAYDWFMKTSPTATETRLGVTDQVYTAEHQGIYRIEITNFAGCKASDIANVINDCVPKIVAPTAFRPGSRVRINDEFFAKTFFITDDFKVFIYNRWGELVYQSNDRFFKWNGGYNNEGDPLPSGAYSYVIQYISTFRPSQGVQEKRGGVVLLK